MQERVNSRPGSDPHVVPERDVERYVAICDPDDLSWHHPINPPGLGLNEQRIGQQRQVINRGEGVKGRQHARQSRSWLQRRRLLPRPSPELLPLRPYETQNLRSAMPICGEELA